MLVQSGIFTNTILLKYDMYFSPLHTNFLLYPSMLAVYLWHNSDTSRWRNDTVQSRKTVNKCSTNHVCNKVKSTIIVLLWNSIQYTEQQFANKSSSWILTSLFLLRRTYPWWLVKSMKCMLIVLAIIKEHYTPFDVMYGFPTAIFCLCKSYPKSYSATELC